jgi:hypothetical protein
VRGVHLTHVGGPTVLIEVEGWRLLTDPAFDDPGRRYAFGWGAASRKLAGPAIAAADIGPIDAVLITHEHQDCDGFRSACASTSINPRQRRPTPEEDGGVCPGRSAVPARRGVREVAPAWRCS